MSGFHDPFLSDMPQGQTPSPGTTSGPVGDLFQPSPLSLRANGPNEAANRPPFEGLTTTFVTADPMTAGDFLCLIPADVESGGGLNLGAEMKGSLRAEIRLWVDNLRKRSTTAAGQLRPLSPRDEVIDRLATQMVEQASKSRTGVWTAALPTGRQLALVRQDVFQSIGLDQLVRCIHHQAIKVAMANGDPYSQAALQVYEGIHPEMSASGVG